MPPKRNIGRNQINEYDLPPHLRRKVKGSFAKAFTSSATESSMRKVKLAVSCKAGDALTLNNDGLAILADNAIAGVEAVFIATLTGTPGQSIAVAGDGDIVDVDETYTLIQDELVWLSTGTSNISQSESFESVFSQELGIAISDRSYMVNIQEALYNE